MGRRTTRTEDPLGTRNSAAQAASESAALATMAGGMMLGAMWPKQVEAQTDASRARAPDNDVRSEDQPSPEREVASQQPAITDIPDHAGIRVAVEADVDMDAEIQAANGMTPLPDAAPIAAASAGISANARIEAEVDRGPAIPSVDAKADVESTLTAQTNHDVMAGLVPSNALLPSLFDSVAPMTNDLTGTLNNLTNGVSETLAVSTAQIEELLGPDGAFGEVNATLGESFAATQNVTQSLLSDVAGVAAAPVEPLTSILGAPSNSDSIIAPATASFAPDPLDSSPMIDTASLVPAEVTGITLGFMGTSYADAVDPHDLSFSPLGGGLHGLM